MLTELETGLVISFMPILLYILISGVRETDNLNDAYNEYIKSLANKDKFLHSRKRGKK